MSIKLFWNRVKNLMKEKKVSQQILAEAAGTSYSTLKRWMSKGIIPPLDVTINLKKYFGVSFDYLIDGIETESDVVSQLKDVILSLKKTNEKLRTMRRGR